MFPQVGFSNSVQFWPILHCKLKQRTEVCDTRGTSSDLILNHSTLLKAGLLSLLEERAANLGQTQLPGLLKVDESPE